MISARPYLALKKLYYFQYYIKRPLVILFSVLVICVIILTGQIYYQYATNSRNVKLLRNNTIESGFYRHQKSFITAEGVQPDTFLELTNRDSRNQNEVLFSTKNDLLVRINDLKRIKLSIRNELRLIEQEKQKLQREQNNLVIKNEKLVSQLNRSLFQLKQLELDISANRRRKFEKSCDTNHAPPIIFNPMKATDILELDPIQIIEKKDDFKNETRHRRNKYLHTLPKREFDLSLCPLTKKFKFYVVTSNLTNNQVTLLTGDKKYRINPTIAREILLNHQHYTPVPAEACLFINILEQNSKPILDAEQNNLIIHIAKTVDQSNFKDLMNFGAIASSVYSGETIRSSYDIILPSLWQHPNNFESILGLIPPHSPIDRKYLASYFGGNHENDMLSSSDSSSKTVLLPLERILQVIHRNSIDDLFLFIYNCGANTNAQCYKEKEKMLELSVFLIILPSFTESNSEEVNDSIYLALSRGTIPVIIGKEHIQLPFKEVIDWRKASLILPTARLPEIHFILRSLGPSDIYLLKYHGRRIFENYLATAKQILDTTISIVSIEQFNHPPPAVRNVKTVSYYHSGDLNLDTNCTSGPCLDAKADSLTTIFSSEILGPREKSVISQSYRRNFSLIFTSNYDLWNSHMYSPFNLYPSLPIDPIPTSEFKFFEPEQGYRPIGEGLGGSGNEFSRSLGGEYPNEQFTIVLLTYERKNMLMKTMERLKGMPYLNKVLVVWNGIQHKPTPDLVWPDIGAPIALVKVDQNSLNNRFLPYDAIETDAILSLDDDTPLRQDEIIFAFRVWRQSRERIVGFPGRFHGWDSSQNSWVYNSNHSCELSMVLTGGAFFHKYYTYIYTYNMPEAIRSIVDKFMNCEDIAMNFLVAHITRKPPIKVTSRWTFHCAGCPSSLSEDESHFRERHECLNTFASIYGYMPLLSTQHRSDSVLFKTRLPQNKQKCFRFV